MQRVTIFCGSNPGAGSTYRNNTIALADALHENQIAIVYGGAKVGLMGTLANTMHKRKALMADLCDGFILLPGGA